MIKHDLFVWRMNEAGRLAMVCRYTGGDTFGGIVASQLAAYEIYKAIERFKPVDYTA
jgi:hypothetical protein